MKTLKITLILFLFAVNLQLNAQSDCETGVITPVPKGFQGDEVPLPILDPPIEGFEGHHTGEDYRMLYLVHGLNGNDGSWSEVAGAIEEGHGGLTPRKVYTERPNYSNSQSGFQAASAALRSSMVIRDILPNDYDRNMSMIISHSQGGLVSRYTDRYYSIPVNHHQRTFGGIVTFATSNQGAQLINNKDLALGMIKRMADDMSAGPLSSLSNNDSWLVRIISDTKVVKYLTSSLYEILTVNGGEYFFSENAPPITQEYAVGAQTIQSMNEYTPIVIENGVEKPTNLVAFYCVRDTLTILPKITVTDLDRYDNSTPIPQPIYVTTTHENVPVPISWATLHYFINLVNHEPIFQAQDNEHLTALRAHLWKYDYESRVNKEKRKISNLKKNSNWLRFSPLVFGPGGAGAYLANEIKLDNARIRRDAWQKGVTFMENFDQLYRIAIGASLTEIVNQGTWVQGCDCYDPFTEMNYRIIPEGNLNCDSYNNLNFWECEEFLEFTQVPIVTWRHKDSDGVVLAESAMDIPQHTDLPRKLNGSTHMRIRNDVNTRDALEFIFEGGSGNFFLVEPK